MCMNSALGCAQKQKKILQGRVTWDVETIQEKNATLRPHILAFAGTKTDLYFSTRVGERIPPSWENGAEE